MTKENISPLPKSMLRPDQCEEDGCTISAFVRTPCITQLVTGRVHVKAGQFCIPHILIWLTEEEEDVKRFLATQESQAAEAATAASLAAQEANVRRGDDAASDSSAEGGREGEE